MTEKEYKKEAQAKQTIKKVCSKNDETYLKWKMQLDHVLKDCPYESPKAKLDMAEAIVNGNLLESWEMWHQKESEKETDVEHIMSENVSENMNRKVRIEKLVE